MLDSLLNSMGGATLPTGQSWEDLEARFLNPNDTKSGALIAAQEKRVKLLESMDFEETESVAWRKHHLRRFFQDRGTFFSLSRVSTIWKWLLTILIGIIIALMGLFVKFITSQLVEVKLGLMSKFLDQNNIAASFFSFLFISQGYILGAGLLCALEPAAAGSGIPEIKAYLNGVNLNKLVRVRVLIAKLFGMCLSCASGLPLGKEGPMIHAGSIVGAAVSQGKTITFGVDTSWSKFQELRNDRSKRDFVTFGAAAGVAAAFSAPIGGILFTLEEGASFWSTTLTFRAFFCAMITELTINLLTSGVAKSKSILGLDQPASMFDFGSFNTFQGYHTYELLIFICLGALGGVLGAFFNHVNKRITLFRLESINSSSLKRIAELLILTGLFATIQFVLPLLGGKGGENFSCTARPTQIAQWSSQEQDLLSKLPQFNCAPGQYNQLASLYLVDADTALQQLFHFTGGSEVNLVTFSTGNLMLFLVPYFMFAIATSGTFCPAGLFVPTLLSGAALGRIIGHILKVLFPNSVTDSGSYALIGAAAILGGVSRMTIAGTVIMLEACGNSEYLLPLMLTFAAARYAGNALNHAFYDMQIEIQGLPFLEGQLRSLGLLNYHPVVEVMAKPVRTVFEINRVVSIYELLSQTKHNGFPVVSADGQLRGLILRKTLCSILKLKAFSTPAFQNRSAGASSSSVKLENAGRYVGCLLTHTFHSNRSLNVLIPPHTSFFYDTLERNYPHFPTVEDIQLSPAEMQSWLDVRPYMCTAPYSINESSSISRCYRFFRTMGLRHLIVLDNSHRVTGIVTRKDITENSLELRWRFFGESVDRFLTVDKHFEQATIEEFENSGVAIDHLDLPVSTLQGYTPPDLPTVPGSFGSPPPAMNVSRKESVSSQVGAEYDPFFPSPGSSDALEAGAASYTGRKRDEQREPKGGDFWGRR